MELNDAIRHAKEVAENWKSEPVNCVTEEGRNTCLKRVAEHEQRAEWLTELQERSEADRWIPVSERLPEKDGRFLICTPTGDVATDIFMFGGFAIPYVIAWKHLPKPYESEDNK